MCHTLTDMNCSMFLLFSYTNAKSWSVFSCLLHGVRVLVRVLVSLTLSDKCWSVCSCLLHLVTSVDPCSHVSFTQ